MDDLVLDLSTVTGARQRTITIKLPDNEQITLGAADVPPALLVRAVRYVGAYANVINGTADADAFDYDEAFEIATTILKAVSAKYPPRLFERPHAWPLALQLLAFFQEPLQRVMMQPTSRYGTVSASPNSTTEPSTSETSSAAVG